jgi:hypothetical protein
MQNTKGFRFVTKVPKNEINIPFYPKINNFIDLRKFTAIFRVIFAKTPE